MLTNDNFFYYCALAALRSQSIEKQRIGNILEYSSIIFNNWRET